MAGSSSNPKRTGNKGSRDSSRPPTGRGRGAGRSQGGKPKPRSGGDEPKRGGDRSKPSKAKRIPPPPEQRGNHDRPDSVPDRLRQDDDEMVIQRVDDDRRGGRADGKPGSGRSKRSRRRNSVYVEDVKMGAIGAGTASKLRARLADAAVAFEAERFTEAERLLLSIQRLAPDVPEVHELLGLTHYRLGRWRLAIADFERFHQLTQSVEQHPVWADCHRALKHWYKAEELWLELGAASPASELVEEGRIVQAGALADRGRLADAIRFLERAPKVKGKPGVHHLRRWYATADLYERAGDNSRARRMFADIASINPDFGDAAERAANLH